MSYFTEIPDYKSYSHGEADFHFIYNANSGGGQSFLGGQFFNEKGTLSSPNPEHDRDRSPSVACPRKDEIYQKEEGTP